MTSRPAPESFFDSSADAKKLLYSKNSNARRKVGEKKRQAFLDQIHAGKTIGWAVQEVGWSASMYKKSRYRYPEWAAQVDHGLRKQAGDDAQTPEFKGGFADFRLVYFGMDTPWFHQIAIDAYENAPPGSITLILWPPEHGKTTLFEDFACYKLATEPEFRITVGAEAQPLSRKILKRVKLRMSPTGPTPAYVSRFGPFEPQGRAGGGSATQQAWGADQFDVFKKQSADERDYSMVALGMTSQIAGTRTDQLHGDDLQSIKTANRTTEFFEMFRQDWLSRPGERGRTSVNGTRVREDDIYFEMMKEFDDDILRVIKFPAVIPVDEEAGTFKPLWEYDEDAGSGYTMEMLERMKNKVGEDAWQRNYMQAPQMAGTRSFDEEKVKQCYNPLRRAKEFEGEYPTLVTSVDPGLQPGLNATMVCQHLPDKLVVVDYIEDPHFNSWEQAFARIEDMVRDYPFGSVSDVVFETVAYQRGLINDSRMQDMRDEFGFNIRPHQTGMNKYDADIGIPSMATMVNRGELDIPGGDDDLSRWIAEEGTRQLLNWRPGFKGTELKQEFVVCLWFNWTVWRERRRSIIDEAQREEPIRRHALPWKPTSSGLLIPKMKRSA